MGFGKYECAACGAETMYIALKSMHVPEGCPDLDSRPTERKRDIMSGWVQECSECGYVEQRFLMDRTVAYE